MSDNYRLNYRGLQTYDTEIKKYIKNSLPTIMSGATKYHDGKSGLTPTPIIGDQNRFLRGDGTWSDIPSFISLYDVNDNEIVIEQDETDVSFIECNLSEKVDLEGHLTVSLFSSENCNIHVRIKDDNVTEPFAPQIFEVSAGYYSFGIPHAYIGKKSGSHNFSVTIQCSNGTIIIPTRGLMYTIFGFIDESYKNYGVDIIDMAIKKTYLGAAPSEFWTLGFETDEEISELMLRKNDYNNPNGNKWEDVYNFGNAKGGAIEFYGDWGEDQSKNFLTTKQSPFLFIIDNKNNLYVYTNDNYQNGELLAYNVLSVSACMSYKSNIDSSLDQGLVIAYITTNKNVYYRQYRLINNEMMWDAPEELYMDGDAAEVSVHRLPDYRIGILVSNPTMSKWYISKRTFIGNTYKPELVDSSMYSYSVTNMVPKERINENLGIGIKNVFPENHYHNGFILTFEGKLHFVDGKTEVDLFNSLTANRAGTNVAIKSIEIDNNRLIITTKNDVQGGANFTINWTLKEFITTNKNGCNMVIPTTSYTWNLPTTNIIKTIPENVTAGIGTKMGISMKSVNKIANNISDETNASITANLNITMNPVERFTQNITDITESEININMNTTMALIGNKPV